jgi:hypothetical protein
MSTLNREIYFSSLPFLPRLTSVLQCSPHTSYRFLYVILSANHSLLPFQNNVFNFYTIYLILQYLFILHRIKILYLILVFIVCLSPTWSFCLLLVLICVYCLSVRFLHYFAYKCRLFLPPCFLVVSASQVSQSFPDLMVALSHASWCVCV